MTPVSLAGFGNMKAMSSRGVSSPFSAERDGFVIAEGAAVLVLEAWDVAEARGATILAEVLGGASTADAHHITAPSPGGRGAISCMELALQSAGLEPGDIRQVNAHGTSTPLNDAAEAEAMAKLFGLPGPPVTSIKGVTGHSLGAAGAIEAVAVIESMRRRLIPPTAVTTEVDPELPAIDLVMGEPRPWEPGPTISNSFGFGGHNGSVVLARRARPVATWRRRSRRAGRPRTGRPPPSTLALPWPLPMRADSRTHLDLESRACRRRRPGGGTARRRCRRTAGACRRQRAAPSAARRRPTWASDSTMSTPGSVGPPPGSGRRRTPRRL